MSDIATKLITVADNSPAVADAVNATKVTASGTTVRVDDVLNVEQPLGVQLKSDTLTDFSGVNVTRYGKNLFDISAGSDGQAASYYDKENNYLYNKSSSKNEYVFAFIQDIWHIAKAVNKPISFSFEMRTDIAGPVAFYTLGQYRITMSTGQQLSVNATTEWQRYTVVRKPSNFWIDTSDNSGACKLSWYGQYGSGVRPYIRNIQIEIDETPTEYEPCLIQTATSDSSGKVTGLTSASPSMTIVPDSDAVAVECTYFPESAAGIYAKYQQLRTEQTSLRAKLQEYKEA